METSRSTPGDRVFRFGQFELSESEGELRKNGVRIKLQEQPFRVLLELAANAGKVVAREELQQKLWLADTFVDFDVGLNTAIRKLRQALDDDADSPHYIETLARRGYRFLAQVAVSEPVQPVAEPADARSALPAATTTHAAVSAVEARTAEKAPTTAPLADEPRPWRERIRLWQLAVAGVALLAVGVGIAWWMRPAVPRDVTAQRITANPADTPVTGAVISPDGKYVAYSDRTGVYVRHIDSGETRPLAVPKGFDGVPTSWFPDSTHLLINNGEGLQHTAKIWKVSILGGDPQMLLEDAEQGTVSPDGSQILFFREDADLRQPWLADADGRAPHRLAAQGPEHSGKMTTVWSATWSPDGRRIAYIERQWFPSFGAIGDENFLYTSKADGSDPRLVLQENSLGSVVVENGQALPPPLCWAPEGRLYFAPQSHSNPGSQDHSIWSVAVDPISGKMLGQPQELLKSLGWIGGLSASQAGKRLVFWRSDLSRQTFISEFDRTTLKMSSPRRLTLDQSVSNLPVDWTADSKAVVFTSNRHGKFGIYKQMLDETTPAVMVETVRAQVTLPRLSANGREVLYAESERPNDPYAPVSLLAVPLSGGTPRVILSEPGIINFLCAKPPSSVCMLNESSGQSNLSTLLDLNKGRGRVVARSASYDNWGISPDGSTLVLVPTLAKGHVRFFSIDSGVAKDVVLSDWPILKSADWYADNKTILSVSVNPNGVPVILGIDMMGNARVLLEGNRSSLFAWLIPSPDGKYGALAMDTGESNVWMVENY